MVRDKLNILWALFIAVGMIWFVSSFVLYGFFGDWTKSGSFGDGFGAINSLFSGLAFAGIVYTILLQRKELELQREELRETRKELKRSADSQEMHLAKLKEESRIKNLPYFQFESESKLDKTSLIIQNFSDNPAFDVEFWIFCTIPNDLEEKSIFIKNHMADFGDGVIDRDGLIDDFWAIHERGTYISFPGKGRINIPLNFPVDILNLEIYLQYRDVQGENYSQELNLVPGELNDKPFVPKFIMPIVPKPINRVNFFESNISDYPDFATDIYNWTRVSVFIGSLMDNLDITISNRWPIS